MESMMKSKMRGKMVSDTAPGVEPCDEYPYGLKITLEAEELYKLGIDVEDSYVGENLTIQAEGHITSISKEGDDSKTLSIQITGLTIDKQKRTLGDAANFAKFKMGMK